MTLAEFLLARIAEDETAAREAIPSSAESMAGTTILGGKGQWSITTSIGFDYEDDVNFPTEASIEDNGWAIADTNSTGIPPIVPVDTNSFQHIARWDPARVLAECDAKRRIVEKFAPVVADGGDGEYRLRQVLQLLAFPYKDHPDYSQNWKPDDEIGPPP